jgi:hypothetical protein
MLNYREFDNRHYWRRSMLCLSNPGFREAMILLGEKIKANSWVIGVKVFADHIWQKALPGEYQSFSIGERGSRVPRVRFG